MIKKFSPHPPSQPHPITPVDPLATTEDDEDLDVDVEVPGYQAAGAFALPDSPGALTPLVSSHPQSTPSSSLASSALSHHTQRSTLGGDPLTSQFSMKKNILASDVEVKGTIKFDEELIFDGKIDGEFLSEGTLILGENSDVQGEVKTRAVSLSGRVQGNITVDEKCELKGRAQLIGDLKAARLVIEEGATFVGRSEVTPNRVNMPKGEGFRLDEGKSAAAR